MMHRLNEQTRVSLYRKVGLTYEQMQQMNAEEIDAFIEKRMGKKLTPAYSLKNFVNRGSVYIFFKRLMPQSYIDKHLSRI